MSNEQKSKNIFDIFGKLSLKIEAKEYILLKM